MAHLTFSCSRIFCFLAFSLRRIFLTCSIVLHVQALDHATLKKEVDSFFGPGEFERFLEKDAILGRTEEHALSNIEYFFYKRALHKWEDKTWRQGDETPAWWWDPSIPLTPDEDFYYLTTPGCSIDRTYIYDQDSSEFKKNALEFLQNFQEAIRKEDRQAFSEFFAFPAQWYINLHESIELKTPKDVIQNFDRLLYPEMKEKLLNLKVETITPLEAHAWRNIRAGSGMLWLRCDMKIYKAFPPMDEILAAATAYSQKNRRHQEITQYHTELSSRIKRRETSANKKR